MPPKKSEPTIEYHVGQGRQFWHEAVCVVPVGASDEAILAVAETVGKLQAAFPIPVTQGIWYSVDFVSAYLAVSTPVRLQALLVAMGGKGVFDPGAVTIDWGQKHPSWTVAETVQKDGDYLEWLGKQDSPEARRIVVAANAYNVLKTPKSTKEEN